MRTDTWAIRVEFARDRWPRSGGTAWYALDYSTGRAFHWSRGSATRYVSPKAAERAAAEVRAMYRRVIATEIVHIPADAPLKSR